MGKGWKPGRTLLYTGREGSHKKEEKENTGEQREERPGCSHSQDQKSPCQDSDAGSDFHFLHIYFISLSTGGTLRTATH